MINASNEFKKLNIGQDNKNYLEYADITLANGTELHLINKHLWNGGFSIEDAVSSDTSFDIGAAIINKCTLSICNIYDDFSDYDFEDAKVMAYIGLELPDGTIEKLRKGTFAVDEPKYNGSIITLECLDNMRKFDKAYSLSKLTYPASLGAIVRDACTVCGVTLQTPSFPHNDFVIQSRPTDEAITFREIISWAAQIAGCFCRCDAYGRLELKWYDQTALENPKVIDWSADDRTGPENAHWLRSHYAAPVTSLEDVVITGVRVIEKNESEESQEELTTYQSGADGYVISIEDNELIKSGAGQTVAGWLGEQLIGMRFRKATLSHASDPTIEAGDVAMVTDRKGNSYNIVVSSTKFSTGSAQSTICGAENPARNSSERFSARTKNYVEWRKAIQKEKTEREKALNELGERLVNSPGVFTTVEKQPNGGNIYYLHNKPALSESDMIWKMTAEAWGVSTDGGQTWNAGMSVDGDTIVHILTATGVNCDWLNAGAITVWDSDGNIIFSVDMDTKQVIISGDSVRIGGKSATQALADNLTEAKNYSDGKLADYANTVSNDLSILQAQVDGQVEDWYYDYEPSMQNYPASEWTTIEDRTKHIGDRFFWKSKGYAYRFMEDNGVWGWVLLQDTDITKAMQAAQNAQDIADGKRRTFVTTPQPPYDIGDLWTDGTDVLTCVTSRAAGSVFASDDWQKLNQYTDDTVANEALEEAKKARNLNIILDNEYQGIPADYQGNIAVFPEVKTFVQALYGHTDVSASCIYTIEKSSGVTGTWDNARRTYTVTALTTDSGWVDITANYANLFTATKRFSVAKIKGGEPGQNGEPGEAGRTYFMEPSTLIVKRSKDDSMAPNYITLSAYYRDGTTTARTAYEGRFKIEESLDGANWKTVYTSNANEASITHSLYSVLATSAGGAISTANGKGIGIPRDVVALRCTLYAAGGTTQQLDMQSVAVVLDVDALTAEEILEILSGGWQGIYSAGDKYYISAEFIKTGEMSADRIRGGTLVLGGLNNGNGAEKILDASGAQIGKWDKDGINTIKGIIGGMTLSDNGLRYGTSYVDAESDDVSVYAGQKGLWASDGSRHAALRGGHLCVYGTSTVVNYKGQVKKIATIGREDGSANMYPALDINMYGLDGEGYTVMKIGKSQIMAFYGGWGTGLLSVNGTVGCTKLTASGTKNRVVKCHSYGDRLQYCYEMSSPMFGDIGSGITDENGECIVALDDIFLETVATAIEYQVFLQKEGQGDLWVDSKESAYFIVKGTPNLEFSWEVKMTQRDFEYERLEEYPESYEPDKEIEDEIHVMESSYEEEINKILEEEDQFLYEES